MVKLGNDWDNILADEWSKPYYRQLHDFLKSEYSKTRIYPDMYDIFNALRYTSFENTRAVIIGQDPYHGPGQAHGLCFSVKDGVEKPPSLENIFKELQSDLGCDVPRSGNLTKWARQGVLMMNTSLTVRAHRANSHSKCGWAWFTDSVILISEKKEHVVFILWGGNARSKKPLIDTDKHLILECAHPSPLSAFNGFFGCRHFSKTNAYLKEHGIGPIDWDLTK